MSLQCDTSLDQSLTPRRLMGGPIWIPPQNCYQCPSGIRIIGCMDRRPKHFGVEALDVGCHGFESNPTLLFIQIGVNSDRTGQVPRMNQHLDGQHGNEPMNFHFGTEWERIWIRTKGFLQGGDDGGLCDQPSSFRVLFGTGWLGSHGTEHENVVKADYVLDDIPCAPFRTWRRIPPFPIRLANYRRESATGHAVPGEQLIHSRRLRLKAMSRTASIIFGTGSDLSQATFTQRR